MELQDLALFKSIVECGSMTRAAEAYGMTQPSVSRHLQRLEQEVGTLLIDRAGAPLTPTPDGRHFLAFAESVLGEWVGLQEQLGRPDSITGELRLGVTASYAGGAAVTRWMARFVEKYRGVRPRLMTMDSRAVEAAAVQHRVSAGFMGCPPQDCCLESLPVEQDTLVLVTPTTGEWASLTDPVNADALYAMRFVRRERGSGTWETVEHALVGAGRSPHLNVVLETDSVDGVLAAVGAGVGASFVSAAALAHRDTPEIRSFHIRGMVLRRQVYLVYDPTVLMRNPLAALFCRFIEQAADEEGPVARRLPRPRRIG
ncbi:MAG: LysR family transcriptional regulator [Thermaerobacter sp.]|nr:LysR family transcriptional regulator [Thermaerobacter sp.]